MSRIVTPEEWYEQGRIISTSAHRIFVRDNGKNLPILLLLHGFPTSSWDWYKVWPILNAHYRLVAPDFLGFGFSAKPYPYPYTISDQTDIIESLLQQMAIKRCCVLAHDYAVSVVQELLWRRLTPGNNQSFEIDRAILLNGGLFPETHRARPIQKLLLGRWGKWVNFMLTKRSLRKNLIRVFGPDTPPSDSEINGFWKLINHNNGKRCFHLLIRYMNDRIDNRESWVRALQETKTPVMLINGPQDPVSGLHMVTRYRQLISNADVHILDGIGHYPNVEAPEAVAEIVLNKTIRGNEFPRN